MHVSKTYDLMALLAQIPSSHPIKSYHEFCIFTKAGMYNEMIGNYYGKRCSQSDPSDLSEPAIKPHIILLWNNNPKPFCSF